MASSLSWDELVQLAKDEFKTAPNPTNIQILTLFEQVKPSATDKEKKAVIMTFLHAKRREVEYTDGRTRAKDFNREWLGHRAIIEVNHADSEFDKVEPIFVQSHEDPNLPLPDHLKHLV